MMKYVTPRSALRLDVLALILALGLLFVVPTNMSSATKELVLAVAGILAGAALFYGFKSTFLKSSGVFLAGSSVLILLGLLAFKLLGT